MECVDYRLRYQILERRRIDLTTAGKYPYKNLTFYWMKIFAEMLMDKGANKWMFVPCVGNGGDR